MSVAATTSLRDRLLSRIKHDRETGCWVWQGGISNGYGYFTFNGKTHRAHRATYEEFVGEIPDGLHIDHLCRNTACVNPDHLEPVTCRENVLRGESPMAKNAVKTHCPRGHEYTPENTIKKRTGRYCRKCKQLSNQRHHEHIAIYERRYRERQNVRRLAAAELDQAPHEFRRLKEHHNRGRCLHCYVPEAQHPVTVWTPARPSGDLKHTP